MKRERSARELSEEELVQMIRTGVHPDAPPNGDIVRRLARLDGETLGLFAHACNAFGTDVLFAILGTIEALRNAEADQ